MDDSGIVTSMFMYKGPYSLEKLSADSGYEYAHWLNQDVIPSPERRFYYDESSKLHLNGEGIYIGSYAEMVIGGSFDVRDDLESRMPPRCVVHFLQFSPEK